VTLSARFSLLHSELNDFLFASVGDEQNGMPLNVISALTRLGIDPWQEAARLAALPKALAAEALAPLIARLPVSRPLPSDNLAISQRLVELLPNARASRAADAETADRKRDKRYFRVLLLLACIALGMAAATAIL
jgi:hypothetical protein